MTVIFLLSSGSSDRYLTVIVWFVYCRIGKLLADKEEFRKNRDAFISRKKKKIIRRLQIKEIFSNNKHEQIFSVSINKFYFEDLKDVSKQILTLI